MNDDLGATAREACASLAKHYSDPIHYSSPPPSDEGDANDGDQQIHDIDARHGEKAPYFDSTLGGPMPDLAPVCGFWYRRLLEASAQAVSSGVLREEASPLSLDAAQELLCCYESTIHPIIDRRNKSSTNIDEANRAAEREYPLNAKVEIIRNYELLLAHLMREASAKSAKQDHVVKVESSNLVKLMSGTSSKQITNSNEGEVLGRDEVSDRCSNKQSPELNIGRIIHIIADDIIQWSIKLPKKGKPELWKVRNVLLPCLLRLMEHSVRVLALSNNKDIARSLCNTQTRESLAVAAVAAISFVGDGKLKSGVFGIGSLLDWTMESTASDNGNKDAHRTMPAHHLSLAHTLQSCSPSPISKTEEINTTHEIPVSSYFMTRSVIDWSVPANHFDAPWTDGVSGIGSRAAMDLLHTIQQSAQCFESSSLKEVEVNNLSGDRPFTLRQLLRRISQSIGVDVLASKVRAHFFGRLPHSYSSDADKKVQSTASGVFMPMVKRIGNSDSNRAINVVGSSDEKPHIDAPTRISAAAILLCAALPQPCDNFDTWDKASSDALPIAMTLLDDVKSMNQAIGALILLSVIEAASSFDLKVIPSFVKSYGSLMISSLKSAIQLCSRGEPTIITTICLAQSKWIGYLGTYACNPNTAISPSEVSTFARKAASDVLISMSKQAQIGGRDGNDERIAGALVAGINPILAQLAEFPEAASVEIAQLGLSALLPLVGWSGMSLETRSVQISALTGLISLMNGAYPIMPHHGKKIMTEIFLLLDRADKDAEFLRNESPTNSSEKKDDYEVSTAATIKVSLYAAGVSLAICGRGAESILEHIESTHALRKPLLERCIKICDASEQLRSSTP